MAKTYYDSALSGPEIEAALQKVKAVAKEENAGKIVAVDENGGLIPIERQADTTELENRVKTLEDALLTAWEGDNVGY